MKYVQDRQHGFETRPHYEPAELDVMFERLVVGFLKEKYQDVRFPITTEDLKTLIERDVSDLEQYADLSRYGPGVEGRRFSRVRTSRRSSSRRNSPRTIAGKIACGRLSPTNMGTLSFTPTCTPLSNRAFP